TGSNHESPRLPRTRVFPSRSSAETQWRKATAGCRQFVPIGDFPSGEVRAPLVAIEPHLTALQFSLPARFHGEDVFDVCRRARPLENGHAIIAGIAALEPNVAAMAGAHITEPSPQKALSAEGRAHILLIRAWTGQQIYPAARAKRARPRRRQALQV